MAKVLPAAGDLVMFKPEVWTDLAYLVSLPRQTVAYMVGVVEQDFEYRLQAGCDVFGDPDPAGGSAAVGVREFLVHTALHDLTVIRRAIDDTSDQVADMLPAPGDDVMFKPDMWIRVALTLQLEVECMPDLRGVCFALKSDPDIASGVVCVSVVGHEGKLGGPLMMKCEQRLLTVTKRNFADNASEFVHSWQIIALPAADGGSNSTSVQAADPLACFSKALDKRSSDGDSEEAADEAILNQLDGSWDIRDYSNGSTPPPSCEAVPMSPRNLEVSDDDMLENLFPAKDLTQ